MYFEKNSSKVLFIFYRNHVILTQRTCWREIALELGMNFLPEEAKPGFEGSLGFCSEHQISGMILAKKVMT